MAEVDTSITVALTRRELAGNPNSLVQPIAEIVGINQTTVAAIGAGDTGRITAQFNLPRNYAYRIQEMRTELFSSTNGGLTGYERIQMVTIAENQVTIKRIPMISLAFLAVGNDTTGGQRVFSAAAAKSFGTFFVPMAGDVGWQNDVHDGSDTNVIVTNTLICDTASTVEAVYQVYYRFLQYSLEDYYNAPLLTVTPVVN